MALNLTDLATVKNELDAKTPQIVLEIDGVTTLYGAVIISKFLVVGDPDWTVGEPLFVGGEIPEIGSLRPISDQRPYISLGGGTSTKISQKLNPDTGKGSSISSMQVALIDKDQHVTNLITPGNVVTDILGRKAKVWLGYEDTAFKDDFIIIFRGLIDDIDAGAGLVTLNIAHPDQKRTSSVLEKATTELDGGIDDSVTTISVDNAASFLTGITGPSGSVTSAMRFYARVNDEVFEYTGVSGNDLTGVVRGQLGTIAAAHSDADGVESIVRIQDSAINLANRMMLSGWNGPFIEDVEVTSFNFIGSGTDRIQDAAFFNEIDLQLEYGLTAGDYITTTTSVEASNNVTLVEITDVVKTDNGSYLVAEGAGFVDEGTTLGVIDFRSQYDVYAQGLKMSPDEVDVEEMQRVNRVFLSSFNYDFYIKDTIDDAKEWIDEQVFNPAGAFSVPRKGRSSVGVHSPPVPGTKIKNLSSTNVINPGSIKIRRTTTKNFFNSTVYKFENLPLEERLVRGFVTLSATSLARIPVGNKSLVIESEGMRVALGAETQANSATSRRLKKYRFGAEFITGLNVNFKAGFTIEIGDILLFDLQSLQVSDIQTGDRVGEPRLFECVNRSLDVRNGAVQLSLTDTSFDKDVRYALISPASNIKSGSSSTTFIIEETGNSVFGINEFRKWEDYVGTEVVVRSADYVTSGSALISSIVGNTITVATPLGFTPTNGMIMEMKDYNGQIDAVKLIYGFMTDSATFADGGVQYKMI